MKFEFEPEEEEAYWQYSSCNRECDVRDCGEKAAVVVRWPDNDESASGQDLSDEAWVCPTHFVAMGAVIID